MGLRQVPLSVWSYLHGPGIIAALHYPPSLSLGPLRAMPLSPGRHSRTAASCAGDEDKPAPEASRRPSTTLVPDAIEVASQSGDDDEFDPSDQSFNANDGSTSVTSSVYACTYERGRRYHCFKNARYPIPNDDQEQDREDMKHAMLMELTDGTLFYSPIGEHPQSILDIGTGTGELVAFVCCGVLAESH